MIRYEGTQLYPMDLKKITLGEKVIYDRTVPGPPWFILDLSCGGAFIPSDADYLITSDSLTFRCRTRFQLERRGE